ncbi:hypothetical protein P7K49_005351 [Saguinus oedipus]|uniref:Uncharacterized protein n=1 Tax=Saguinus oedipus TaxID=9490 RepID=A0ABQ9WBM8_SAGOE|nr:hypothetical protein P7K49_005351 [Saguinus oedipus]
MQSPRSGKGPNNNAFLFEPAPRAGEGDGVGLPEGASLWRLDPLPLRVLPSPISSRETKDKMELLGPQGPLDLLGPGALLVTLGKMAPGEHKAQRARRDPQGPRTWVGRQTVVLPAGDRAPGLRRKDGKELA